MMKHSIVPLIIFEFYLAGLCECLRNNVCKTLSDYRTIQTNPNCWYNPDVDASAKEIIERYGFPFESYEVTTQDGYILNLFRIPHHNGSNIGAKRPVVFLQHGFAADSINWLILGSKASVFVFANNGYDVWISNSRGTKYSSKHIKYTTQDPEYWLFSFHEMALYDVPAMLDFIVQKTGQAGRITYIGHSMGTTISYIYASLLPQQAKKNLKTIISLAPIAYMDHARTILRVLVPFRYLIAKFLISSGVYGIGPHTQLNSGLSNRLCTKYPFIVVCVIYSALANGFNEDEFLLSEFAVAASHFPSGFSFKTLLHYADILAARQRFQFFDYGPKLNRRLYNSSIPPEYPLSHINVPVHLFYGKKDLMSAEKDVYHLYDKLQTEKTIMEVFNFAHLDFATSARASDFYKFLLKYF